MRAVAPRLGEAISTEITVAEDQHDYLALTAAVVRFTNGTRWLVARYTLTPEERARIAKGEDLYLSFPTQMAPHHLGLRPEYAEPLPE